MNYKNIYFLLQVIALKVKRNGEWKTWTYERYVREVELAARGFIHVGMSRHRSVAIIGQNSPEWVISDLAAIFSGKTRTMCDFHNFGLIFARQMHCLPQRLKSRFFERLKSTFFEIFSNGAVPNGPGVKK